MKESYKKGDSDSILALSLAGDIARCHSKRRQGYRWAGYGAWKNAKPGRRLSPDRRKATRLFAIDASEQTVLRSRRTRARRETTCTRTGRPLERLGPQGKEAGPRRPKATRRTRTLWEESDRAIVSMNQANKEERSSAEPGERRARAKENIVPFNTHPTQCGERGFQGWSGVRVAAPLANPPRWEPYAVMPLVRFCAGGDQQ